MEEPALYLAFVNGAYDYVCAECTALCCRGQGFAGNLEREMRPLLEKFPALGLMVTERKGPIVSCATPTGGCFFLDADHRCRVEKQFGKTLKPGVCNLFPFNVFTRIGDTVAVSPHFMCPLRLVVPARPGAVAGTHADLLAQVHESRLIGISRTEIFSPVLPPAADEASIVAQEEAFRDRCGEALGRDTFSATVRGAAVDRPGYDRVLERAWNLLGALPAPDRPRPDRIDDVLLALASPLRLRLLHLDPDAILVTLGLAERVLRATWALTESPASLQGAHQLLTSVAPALRLLAAGDAPVEARRARQAARQASHSHSPSQIFSFLALAQALQRGTGVLDACEAVLRPSTPIADRMSLFIQLGEALEMPLPPPRKKAAAV